jgi:hypothetical protein
VYFDRERREREGKSNEMFVSVRGEKEFDTNRERSKRD